MTEWSSAYATIGGDVHPWLTAARRGSRLVRNTLSGSSSICHSGLSGPEQAALTECRSRAMNFANSSMTGKQRVEWPGAMMILVLLGGCASPAGG